MARTRKSIQALNLYKYDVLIEETGIRSDYFKITQFDGYFYGGRNAFLVAGSNVLKSNTKILVEVLNKDGQAVYSAPVASFVEGNSRLVKIEVYEDTPIGPGKLILLGSVDTYLDGTPIPEEWRGKYNVRWITDVIISPLVKNKTPIRFEQTPSLTVTEKLYAAPSSSQYIETISIPVNVQLTPKKYNIFPNGYLINLNGPTTNSLFNRDYIGGILTGSISFTGSTGIESADINIPISKIYNLDTAESQGSLIYTNANNLITHVFVSSSGVYSSSINLETPVVLSSNINLIYGKLNTQFTGSLVSFADIRVVDLETLSGEIDRVRLSFKRSTDPGEFVFIGDVNTNVRELFTIDSGSTIVNTGDFSKIDIKNYWYNATMSLQKNDEIISIPDYYFSSSLVPTSSVYKNDIDLIDAISATPSIVSGSFIDQRSYFIGTSNINTTTLFPRSEYTLAFNAVVSVISASSELSQTDSSLEVYLVPQENSNSRLLTTDPRGQLIGIITPTRQFRKQNFERVELNFVPKIKTSGKYGLRFVVYGGHWSISDVSVKASEEPFFSPDEINILFPIQNYEQDILTFKAEFLDINNNSANTQVFSIPTYFTGSSDYVKKAGDYMTGELYINGLPMQQQALQDSFTGLVSGGVITVNTPASWSYTVSSGSGYVVDNYTNPLNPTYTYVTWPQFTKVPDAFVTPGSIASYPRTNIAISASGQVIEQSTEWTPNDYRKYIILGRIAHVGTTFIQRALSLPLTTYNRGFHWFDLANAIGIINVEGNIYYASGSGMSIGKTSGKTYRVGSNYRNDPKFPDITTDPSSLPVTFSYRYRSGSLFAETPLTTFITGSVYDDGSGILQTVNPNKFTVQRIYYFGATNTTRIQFGQNEYNTMVEAQDAAVSEQFTVDPNLERDSALRAFLIVGSSATDLSDLSQAEFIPQGKFGSAGGGSGGGGGGASTLAGLTDVSLTGLTSGQYLQYNGTFWVNNGLSGSLFGTSSWASNAISSSVATTASYTINADLLDGLNSTIFATTGSNVFVGNQSITGSLTLSSSLPVELRVIGDTEISGSLRTSGSFVLGSQIFYPQSTNGFSVNENYDPSNNSSQVAYHFTTGTSVKTSVVFSLARTSQFTSMFGVTGSALDNRFVIGSEYAGTDFEFRNNLGIRPVQLQGGTLLARITRTGHVLANAFTSSLVNQVGFLGTSSWASSSIGTSFAQTASNLTGGTANYIPLWTSATAQSSSNIAQNAGNIVMGTDPGGLELLRVGGNIRASGNSHIVGAASSTTAINRPDNTGRLDIGGGASTSATVGARAIFQGVDVSAGSRGTLTLSAGLVASPTTGEGTIYLQTSGSNRITITPTGEVGVGVLVPQRRLHVDTSGSDTTQLALTSVNSNNRTGILFASSSLGDGKQHALFHRTNTNLAEWLMGASATETATWILLPQDNSNFGLYVTVPRDGGISRIYGNLNQALSLGANGVTDILYVTGSRNVGINTNNPQYKLDVSGSVNVSENLLVTGSMYIRSAFEHVIGTSSAPPTTLNYNVLDGAILFYSASTTANWTLNFRGNASTTLNSVMPLSSSLTVTLLTQNGATPYSASLYQIDGTSITPRWQGGISGSGNADSLDAHTFTIIKISNVPTYLLLGSITKYT